MKPFRPHSPLVEIEVTVRRLVGPPLRDAVTSPPVAVGPEIDEERAWIEYRRHHPDRRYAIAKRRLGKADLRRHGLQDHAPDEVSLDLQERSDRASK